MDAEGAAAAPADPPGAAAHVATAKAAYAARDYAAAAEEFQAAAAEGSGEAMGCLGYMQLEGRGMQAQPVTGVELLRLLAQRPHFDAEARDMAAFYRPQGFLHSLYVTERGRGVVPRLHRCLAQSLDRQELAGRCAVTEVDRVRVLLELAEDVGPDRGLPAHPLGADELRGAASGAQRAGDRIGAARRKGDDRGLRRGGGGDQHLG